MRSIALLLAGVGLVMVACPCTQALAGDRPIILEVPATRPDGTEPSLIERGVEYARALVPKGPADPVYVVPRMDVAAPSLALVTDGTYRYRVWSQRQTDYAGGLVQHMPLWFKDPMDSLNYPASASDTAWSFIYPQGRFMANLGALPVSSIADPIWKPAFTDDTVGIVETFEGPRLTPSAADPAGRSQ